jgi:hypothetical protein
MKRKFLIWLQEWLVKNSSTPWACFETGGPDAEGRLSFSISWNKAFINNLHRHGIQELNDEQTVQMFFIQSRMLPEEMVNDQDTVNPEAMPNLTNEANTLRR